MANPYKDILKLVNTANKAKTLGEQFVADINKYFQLSKEPYSPSSTIKPSMIGGCVRRQYAVLIGAPQDLMKLDDAAAITINHSGSDRHLRLQYACQDAHNFNIDIQWLDPENEVKKAQAMGINTIVKRRDGYEVLCYNEDYHLQFKCDGIITYKDVKMILEIKTETEQKWMTRFGVKDEHLMQATCYSLCFGIDKVMFLYENRNTTQRKAFVVEITEEQKQLVKDKINLILNYYNNNILPPKEKDKCTYCDYKQWCKKQGDSNEVQF